MYQSIQKKKKTESRSKKIVHKVQFFTIHREKFPVRGIYIYKKKNSPRKTHSLSIFFFILPLDIHRGKEAFFHECSKSSMHSGVHKFNVQLVAQIRRTLTHPIRC